MRLPALLLCCVLLLNACGYRTYERTAGGALIGGATGAMAGAVCCGDPVSGTGKGAVVGILIGAIIGFAIDILSAE